MRATWDLTWDLGPAAWDLCANLPASPSKKAHISGPYTERETGFEPATFSLGSCRLATPARP